VTVKLDKQEVPLNVSDIIKGLPRGHGLVLYDGRSTYKMKLLLIDREPEDIVSYFEDLFLALVIAQISRKSSRVSLMFGMMVQTFMAVVLNGETILISAALSSIRMES